MNTKVRVIAFYLPQYHPIPENDEAWGKGFTEWTNVVQARPLFKGHYQPRIPRDLGFYDLRLPEVREAQAQLARDAGIEGFMYWQYYFGNNRKLLERPFEEVLASGKPDYPFCLGWANHSWQTKTWKRDSSKKEGKTMIMEQLYGGEKQYEEHFMYNLPAFRDRRYIKVDGKPIFVIWNPFDHPDEIALLIKIWKKKAKENGLTGIHFVGIQNIGHTDSELTDLGFNAICQARVQQGIFGDSYSLRTKIMRFVRDNMGAPIHLDKADFGKKYPLLVTEDVLKNNVYPMLVSGYDRSPRAGKEAMIYYNFTPDTWRKHIKDVMHYVKNKDKEHNLIFLKSWNEWGESNYMEPDLRFGSALLDVLREEITY